MSTAQAAWDDQHRRMDARERARKIHNAADRFAEAIVQIRQAEHAAREKALEEAAELCDEKCEFHAARYIRAHIRAEFTHKSDCAVHNAPAYEPGFCDCRDKP